MKKKDEENNNNVVDHLFLLHGYGEHSSRYHDLIEKIHSTGFNVYALDHQGHGLSDGTRGYVEYIDDFVDDFMQFFNNITKNFDKNKKHNIVFVCHSMGGLIGFRVGLRLWDKDIKPNGIFFSAPFLEISDYLQSKFILVKIGEFMSGILPKLTLTEGIEPNHLFVNEAYNEDYRKDPLVYHGTFPARIAGESIILTEHSTISPHMAKFQYPFMIVHSENDKLTNVKGSKKLFDLSATPKDKKKIKIFKELEHELLSQKNVENELFGFLSEITNKKRVVSKNNTI